MTTIGSVSAEGDRQRACWPKLGAVATLVAAIVCPGFAVAQPGTAQQTFVPMPPQLPFAPQPQAGQQTYLMPGPHTGTPVFQVALPEPAANSAVEGSMIQPVQNSADSARALHRLIASMPAENEELEVIERRSQLMNTRANVTRIHIVDPSIVDVVQYGPRELAFLGLARGSTTLMMWFEGETDPIIYLVKTIRDPNLDTQRRVDYGKLEKKINALFPNSKVYLIPLSFKIVVRGQARDQEEAWHILQIIQGEILAQDGSLFGPQGAGYGYGVGGYADLGGVAGGGAFNNLNNFGFGSGLIVNELRVPGEFQISLRVRIAELNRSQARNLGVDFNVLFNNATQQIFTNLGAAGAATLGGIFDSGDISVFVQWLAANGTAKILTEPNVVVISGRQARFLAGGEFAVPTVVGIGGAQGQTTSFRGFGTSLLVTPAVIDRDLIRISTIAEYSDLNQGNAVGGIPGTDSRRVETTVEMREGQTLALAGLLSHRQVNRVTRIPVLGDIPKIGPLLFSSKQSTQEENELLILITPEIVRPMDAHEVPPVPGFEVTHPQDTEFYKYNMTEGAPDTGYYQLPPYGSGSVGTNVGYQHFNPGPANSMYSPQPTNPNGSGFSSPTPMPGGMPSGPATAVPMEAAPPPPSAGVYGPSLQPVPPSSAMRNGAPRSGFSQPAGSPQTIQPANYSGPRSAAAGSAHRGQRDASPGNRY
ncbi:MAG: pilus assembly protein N-terminal domain-containing protein [Planctomycetaceae bacterium]|nr:pilus assembly protein N-terminal domain-containing protein [Planctomycetaceae bacterium]